MSLKRTIQSLLHDAGDPFLVQLQVLYQKMDKNYDDIALYYGFKCTGCDENCCKTKFYHHTLVEYLFLAKGLSCLSRKKEDLVRSRTMAGLNQAKKADKEEKPFRVMCPLNMDGLCLLYAHRPMICRLHGIPHELKKPGNAADFSPGCENFMEGFTWANYKKFDRTPLYMELAGLERSFREKTGISGKFKKTIAQMLGDYFEIS